MLSPEIAASGLLDENSCQSQPRLKTTMRMVISGLYSSHSLGRWRGGSAASSICTSTPSFSAVTACTRAGAESHATAVETAIRMPQSSIDCQRKMVSVKGMTPVIARSGLGMLAAFDCSCAADELKPSAQVAPSPR